MLLKKRIYWKINIFVLFVKKSQNQYCIYVIIIVVVVKNVTKKVLFVENKINDFVCICKDTLNL